MCNLQRALAGGRYGSPSHHAKIRVEMDNYSNLALITGDVHKLIHSTDPVIIQKYLDRLKNCKLNMAKLNKFRLLAGNCKLEYSKH